MVAAARCPHEFEQLRLLSFETLRRPWEVQNFAAWDRHQLEITLQEGGHELLLIRIETLDKRCRCSCRALVGDREETSCRSR